MPEGDMLTRLNCLREICEARDAGRLVVALKEIVLDYSPSADLLERVTSESSEPQHSVSSGPLMFGMPYPLTNVSFE